MKEQGTDKIKPVKKIKEVVMLSKLGFIATKNNFEGRIMKYICKYFLPFVLLFLCGCAFLQYTFTDYGKVYKKADEHYKAGDYDSAVFDCAKSLRLKPEYDKAQRLIKDAFKTAVNVHLDNIKKFDSPSDKFKWDKIIPEYEALIQLNQTIKGLPTLRDKKTKEIIKFEVTDYSQELADSKEKAAAAHYQEGARLEELKNYKQAAEEFKAADSVCPDYKDAIKRVAGAYYQEGVRLSKKGGREFQKQAAKEFKTAESFYPGYKDAAQRYEECRQSGILRMAIIPFEDKSGKGGKYGALSEMITDEIVSKVMSDPNTMEFLELVSRDQLEQILQEQDLKIAGIVDEQTATQLGKVLGVHEILTGQITQIIYTPERTTKKSVREKKRVVTGTRTVTDSEGKTHKEDVYGDVYATVTFHTKTTSASISGSYKIIEVETAKLKKSESFSKKAVWQNEWATFTGDQRALDSRSRSLCRKGEELGPVEEEMVNQAAQELITSLTTALKNYAR